MKVKVNASEALFNKWEEISKRIERIGHLVRVSCCSLFANDMEVEFDSLKKWKDKYIKEILDELDSRKSDINKLVDISREYIKKCNQ